MTTHAELRQLLAEALDMIKKGLVMDGVYGAQLDLQDRITAALADDLPPLPMRFGVSSPCNQAR